MPEKYPQPHRTRSEAAITEDRRLQRAVSIQPFVRRRTADEWNDLPRDTEPTTPESELPEK